MTSIIPRMFHQLRTLGKDHFTTVLSRFVCAEFLPSRQQDLSYGIGCRKGDERAEAPDEMFKCREFESGISKLTLACEQTFNARTPG